MKYTAVQKLSDHFHVVAVFIIIIDAVRRFFKMKVEVNSLKQRGKYDAKLVVQRRRNRIKRVSFGGYMGTSFRSNI